MIDGLLTFEGTCDEYLRQRGITLADLSSEDYERYKLVKLVDKPSMEGIQQLIEYLEAISIGTLSTPGSANIDYYRAMLAVCLQLKACYNQDVSIRREAISKIIR